MMTPKFLRWPDSRESFQGSQTEPRRFQSEVICANRTDTIKVWECAAWGVTKWGLSDASASADFPLVSEAKPPKGNC